MPLQNRVLPDGRIVAAPWRGLFTGNRGILHDGQKTLRRRWTHPHWIICRLDWKGVRRVPMSPRTWTELFFADEAVALAAGHRPCALCRREAYQAFKAAWAVAHGPAGAAEMDRALHATRLTPGGAQRTHQARAAELPDGVMVELEGQPCLVHGRAAHPFVGPGYDPPRPLPRTLLTVLTPEPTLAVLRAGFRPVLHPSVGSGGILPPYKTLS